jgi:DNA repair photolyase
MRVQGGLRPEDWEHWGRFTTFKSNAATLLAKSCRSDQTIYCSPVVDPYQPAEAIEQAMPPILDALIKRPPKVFVIQTRGPLILRDLSRLVELSRVTTVRVTFSLTTNRDEIRRLYEPHCETIPERLATITALRRAGMLVHASLAPLLPCDPEELARLALDATTEAIIGDALHLRALKSRGATTHEPARRISERRGFLDWHDPDFQQEIIDRIGRTAEGAGRRFGTGPTAFAWLSQGS